MTDNVCSAQKRKPLVEAILYERLRPAVQIIAQTMERKFRKHDDWGNPFKGPYDSEFLQRREKEEEKEFLDAIVSGQPPNVVWDEAADRMNFILIKTVEYEKEWRRKNGVKLDDWMVEP